MYRRYRSMTVNFMVPLQQGNLKVQGCKEAPSLAPPLCHILVVVDEVSGRREVAIPPGRPQGGDWQRTHCPDCGREVAIPPRATARVPTPLHTAPALTMKRGE